jgi:hypothetical protein
MTQREFGKRRMWLAGIPVVAFCVAAIGLGMFATAALANPDPVGTEYVANYGANAILVFAPGANGNVAPIRTISGPGTGISGPADVAVDAAGDVYSSNYNNSTITEYAPGASGNATPIKTIGGSNTGLASNDDMSLAPDGTLYVGNASSGSIVIFAPGANGNVVPIRELSGSNTTFSSDIDGVGADAAGNLYAANSDAAAIDKFNPGATGNVAPNVIISGSNTGMSVPDDVKVGFSGQLFVSDANSSLLVFPAGASGNATPTRDITGSNTGFCDIDDLAVAHDNTMYVTDFNCNAVDVFGPSQNGNVAPEAQIAGSNTTLNEPEGVDLAEPTSSLTMSTTATPSATTVGGSAADTATLSGGNSPTGSLVFKLFGPGDSTCSAAPAYTSPAQTVSGDGTYTSPSFSPTTAGTYYWVAEYSGDATNPPITEACGTASETLTVSSTGPSGCTMTTTSSTTVFNTGTQSIHVENTLSSNTTTAEHLVLRSLTGGPQFFSLASLSSGVCHDNTSHGLGSGDSFNTFTGQGTGSFGTVFPHITSGYSIQFEIGDWGDSGSTDSTTADSVNFTIKNSGGTVVWSGRGNLTAGNEEEAG